MARELSNDYAIDALTVEVERRKKQPRRYGYRYSYGKLVADTCLEERQLIAECYRKRGSRAVAERYAEPDDQKDMRRIGGGGLEPGE